MFSTLRFVFQPDYAPCRIDSSPANPTQITLLERIIRTHPVWYLPHISRMAAIHLVRGKEVGNFIVRHSSRVNAMAITVKLPLSSKQDVEHYLVESTAFGIHLEGTSKYFKALPLLLCYYCESDGDLGFKICLPSAILECRSRRDLYSYALLGQGTVRCVLFIIILLVVCHRNLEFWSVGPCLCKDIPPPSCDKYSSFSTSFYDGRRKTTHSRNLSVPAKREASEESQEGEC
ncbi:unnamed protein product [Soboliphyme baturini]|uniref:SH2 domain-containing protein n=1 Tax=Soboliphyme baturini TaxID=241478 RepID=A0A3P8AWV1_9BILA|nr:unnamed protein product [Soboliphyme baturini]